MKVKDKAFIVIGIGILILNISIYSHVKDLKSNMTYTKNELFNIDRSVNSVRNSVNYTLNEIHEKSKWLCNGSYSVTNVSKDFKNATVVLNWSLRSLNNNSKVYLIYRKKPTNKNENDKWTELPIENVDTLNYTKELTLSLNNDYEFKVLVKGDTASTSENLLDINLYSMLKDRVHIDFNGMSKSHSNNHVKFEFSGKISNFYKSPFEDDESNENLLKLKNITIKVYGDGDLKEEFEIFKNGEIVDKNTKFGSFHDYSEMKRESLKFTKTVEYDTTTESSEVIEVIVENYSGRIYSSKRDVF